jgi:hypothetical protein
MSHNFVTPREDFGTMLAYFSFHLVPHFEEYLLLRALRKHEFIFLGEGGLHATFLIWTIWIGIYVACHVNVAHILTKAFIYMWQATSFKEFKQ